jgi:hypothetical protein
MSRFAARLNAQEKLQSVKEASSASSNGWRQFAATCSLNRAAIVVQKHRMSRSMKRDISVVNTARKSNTEAGFQIPLRHELEARFTDDLIAFLLELH